MDETLTDEPRNLGQKIRLEFPTEAVERLDRMKRQTGAISYAELIRNALRLYEWFLKEELDGCDIALVKDDVVVKAVKFLF